MKKTLNTILLLTIFLFSCNKEKIKSLNLIPYPQEVKLKPGSISLQKGFNIKSQNEALSSIVQEEFFLLSGIQLNLEKVKSENPTLVLSINETLAQEEYQIRTDNKILIEAGSYQSLAMASTSFLQMIDENLSIPKGVIKDFSKHEYRSLMIDCARGWHSIENLKQLITLSRWYKIKYLHLHLTDDQLFTFQSKKYPTLATEGSSYSQEELKALDRYAADRGVILVPEIDVPAHASQFIRKLPKVFGIADLSKNSYTMSMGKEEAYQALDDLFGELAEVFRESPYIHIGGDEAHFDGMVEDPETIAYMKKHSISSVDELFRHFLIRMNDTVKDKGKKTLAWAGFSRSGEIKIPTDITILSWESQYYDPQFLIDDGYTVVNASFKPLYIVNNRKWPVEYIYTKWNERRWENGVNFSNDFEGLEIETSEKIIGGTMCSWEQSSLVEMRRARKRLAAFSETLWGTNQNNFSDFENRLNITDAKLQRLLHPFDISTSGLLLAADEESNFYEHLYFDSTMVLGVKPRYDNLELRYALEDSLVSYSDEPFQTPMRFSENKKIKIQAFRKDGKPVGHPFYNRYFYTPIKAIKTGLEIDRLASSWERLRFTDQLKVELQTPRKDLQLRYKTNGSDLQLYEGPISITETTSLSAQLYDQEDKKIGSTLNETYYLLKEKSCLTTGKKTIASNENLRPKMAELVTNGRVSLWEHWSDQTNGDNWILVDLEKEEEVSEFQVHCFWDNYRYYQYTIETSLDGEDWKQVVDYSKNKEKSSLDGYSHEVEKHQARFLRLNILHNSANPGLHITEFCAF